MSEQEIESYKLLLQMSDEEVKKAVRQLTDKQDLQEFLVMVSGEQMSVIQEAIVLSGLDDKVLAIVKICEHYTKTYDKNENTP